MAVFLPRKWLLQRARWIRFKWVKLLVSFKRTQHHAARCWTDILGPFYTNPWKWYSLTYRWVRWGRSHLILCHHVGIAATTVLTEGALRCTWAHAVALTRDHIHTAIIGELVSPVVSIKGHINGVVTLRGGLRLSSYISNKKIINFLQNCKLCFYIVFVGNHDRWLGARWYFQSWRTNFIMSRNQYWAAT